MPMHVASTLPIVTNSARRSHDIIQSDVLLCRTIIQSSDNTSMCVSLSLSFRECLRTPLLCCNACHSYACTALKSTQVLHKDIGRVLRSLTSLTALELECDTPREVAAAAADAVACSISGSRLLTRLRVLLEDRGMGQASSERCGSRLLRGGVCGRCSPAAQI